MSQVEVDKVIPQSGTTLTIGDSGDTINLVGTLQSNGSPLPGDISSVVAGTGLSGGGTTGAVTLNIEAAQPTITSTGTLTGFTSTGIDDNASSTAVTITSGSDVQIGSTNSGVGGSIDLSIGNLSSTGGITLWSPTNSAHSIGFGDGFSGTDRYRGYLEYIHSSDSLRFGTSASERMRINSSGQVGIGTTSPGAGLEVDNANGIKISRSGFSQYMQLYPANNNVPTILGVGGNGIHIGTTTTTGIQVDGSDNVGIGTTSPDTLLSLEKNNAPVIQFKDTSGATDEKIWRVNGLNDAYRIQTWNDALNSNQVAYQVMRSGVDVSNHRFYTEDSERMRLTTTGLGIGTTSPSRALTVSGSVSPVIAIVDTGTSGTPSLFFGDSSADNVGKIQYANSTNSLSFVVNSSQRMNIANSGRVGIGVNSPSGLLHVQSASSGASVNSSGDEIIAENSANAGISILSGNSNQGQLIFGDDGDNNVGRLQYDHSDNSMQFIVNANERARFESSGNFLVGKTSTGIGTVGGEIRNDGLAAFTRDGNTPLIPNRKTSDGTIIEFRKDGTEVGIIGVKSSNVFMSSNTSNNTGFKINPNAITPSTSTGTDRDNAIDLGASSSRYKDLYLGGDAYIGSNKSLFILDSGGDKSGQIANDQSSTNSLQIDADPDNSASNSYIGLKVDNSEKMRITSAGNVGIGTSSPDGKLDIAAPQTTTNKFTSPHLALTSTSQNNSSGFCGISYSSATLTNYGWTVGSTRSTGGDGSSFFTFRSHFNSASGDERMRIDNGGRVGIGTTSLTEKLNVSGITKTAGIHSEYSQKSFIKSSNSNNYTLEIENTNSNPLSQYITEVAFTSASPDNSAAKFFQMVDNTTARVNINSDGDIFNHDGTYGQISDERIKQNIVDASSQWNDIKNIRIRKYKKKDDVIQYGEENAPIELGVISQELETVSPGLVKEDKADKSHAQLHEDFTGDNPQNVKYVKYSILYMKSVKALQEAMERIETLESKNTELESRITQLENA